MVTCSLTLPAKLTWGKNTFRTRLNTLTLWYFDTTVIVKIIIAIIIHIMLIIITTSPSLARLVVLPVVPLAALPARQPGLTYSSWKFGGMISGHLKIGKMIIDSLENFDNETQMMAFSKIK